MQKLIVATLILLAILTTAVPMSAQHRIAVIATGNFHGSSFAGPGDGSFLEEFIVKRDVAPGAEILFNPDRRISFGVAWNGPVRFNSRTFTTVTDRDRFGYFDASGKLQHIEMPGTIFSSVTTTQSPKLDMTVSGIAYVNLRRTGRVRPFVGGGYGIGQEKVEVRNQTYVHPLLAALTGFAFEGPEAFSKTNRIGLGTGKAGVNIHLARHLVVRLAGGYRNGGFGESGVGFAF